MKKLILILILLSSFVGFSQTEKDTLYVDITVIYANGKHLGSVTNEKPGMIEFWLKTDFGISRGYKVRPIIVKRIVDTVYLETVDYDNLLRKDESYILTPKKEDDE